MAGSIVLLQPSGIRRAMQYATAIAATGSFGVTALLNDYTAFAFDDDVIRDMLRNNVDKYAGSTMEIAEGECDICSVAFPISRLACRPWLVAWVKAALRSATVWRKADIRQMPMSNSCW
jgi:hypothetical protein